MSNSPNLYRRGTIWWGRVQIAGVDKRRSLRTADRAEAKRRLAKWRGELEEAQFYGQARSTWQDAVIRFATEVMPNSIKPSTVDRYNVSFRQLDPHLRDIYVDQIRPSTIARIVGERRKAGATNATIRRDLTAMSRVLSACCQWEIRTGNPARDFDRRLVKEHREPIRTPDDEDINAVLTRAPGMFSDLIRFLGLEGCRQEEGASLEWPQIRLQRAEILLTKTKTDRPRVIRIGEETVELLAALPRHLKSKVVFWHDDGVRYSNVASRFREIVKSAQSLAQKQDRPFTPFRCHDLRHRYAIRQLEAGRDIYDLSRHLGHSSVKTTEIYLGHVGRGAGTNAGTSIPVRTTRWLHLMQRESR